MRHFLTVLAAFLCSSSIVIASTQYDFIVVYVNDQIITRNEIDLKAFEFAKMNNINLNSSQDPNFSQIREKVLGFLIEQVLIDSRAEELMIRVSDDQLDEEIDRFRKQRKLGQIEFEEGLEQQQSSLADFRKRYRREIRRNRVLSMDVRSKINVTEEELRKIHEDGLENISRVHARHILLRLDANALPGEVETVRQKIVLLKKQIQSGKSFQEMADVHSEDPSVGNNHGDLGFLKKEETYPEFATVAFNLSPGSISDPVRTPLGFHLIQVLEFKKDAGKPFEQARNQLYQQRYQELYSEKYQQYIELLKKNARIIRR